MNPEEQLVARTLGYPESSVGRLMSPDVISLDSDMTVGDALKYIRWAKVLSDEYLSNLYIVNENFELIGEVSLTTLVSTDPLTLSVMYLLRSNPVTLTPFDDEGQAVEISRKYDRSSFPVVDGNRKLLGVVTGDDIFDVAEDEATEDIQQFGGQGAEEDSYFQTPLMTMLQKRVGWMAVLLFQVSCHVLRLVLMKSPFQNGLFLFCFFQLLVLQVVTQVLKQHHLLFVALQFVR